MTVGDESNVKIWLVLSGKSHICQKEGILLSQLCERISNFYIHWICWMVSFSENYDQGFAHLCSIKSCVTMYLKICLTPFWGASYHLKYNLPSCMLFIQAAGHAGDDPDAAAAAAAASLRCSGLQGVCSEAPCLGANWCQGMRTYLPG